MAKRKRATRRTSLVGRAVTAGRRALREAEKRVPPDLRRQAERRIKDADKTARAAIKALQTQVNRASTRADVNSVLKRIDGLTKQARQVISGTGPRRTGPAARRPATRTRKATSPRRASTTRKTAATRKAATTRKTAAPRKAAATRKPATPRTATRRASAPRRRRASASPEPDVIVAPIAEMGAVEIIELTPEP